MNDPADLVEAPVLLEVHELTVRHGGLLALDQVSLTVHTGQIAGLIGPNGAGKTTCIDALTGFTRPASGRVILAGRSLDGVAPHDRARTGFARTFQSLELFDDLTVAENLLVSAGTPTLVSTLTDVLRPKRHDRDAVDEVLDLVGLRGRGDDLPTALSNSERHLVALGRALAPRPSLVLLDEPTAGLDPAETATLAAVLRRLPERGTTVVLVDHDMALVLGVCDIVHVLDQGRLIASGPPAEVAADPAVIAAYLGQPT